MRAVFTAGSEFIEWSWITCDQGATDNWPTCSIKRHCIKIAPCQELRRTLMRRSLQLLSQDWRDRCRGFDHRSILDLWWFVRYPQNPTASYGCQVWSKVATMQARPSIPSLQQMVKDIYRIRCSCRLLDLTNRNMNMSFNKHVICPFMSHSH